MTCSCHSFLLLFIHSLIACMDKEGFNTKIWLDMQAKQLVRFYVWSIASNGSETWTLKQLGRKYLESFKTWCGTKMEKITWSEKLMNKCSNVYERRGGFFSISGQENPIGLDIYCILRMNCLINGVIEGHMTELKGVGRRGRRRRRYTLDDLRNRRRYLKWKEEVRGR